jgi:hypothetical protein
MSSGVGQERVLQASGAESEGPSSPADVPLGGASEP